MPSARFIEAVTAPRTAEQAVVLVTITHASFLAPIRLCTGGANLVSNGDTFNAHAMKLALPGQSLDANGRRGRLTLDDAQRTLIGPLRAAATKPLVLLELVLAAYPDDVELSWANLELVTARPSGTIIDCELAPRDDSVETWPYQAFTPSRFIGLFD